MPPLVADMNSMPRCGAVSSAIFRMDRPDQLDVAYSDKQARAVSVDSAALTEALRKVYDANALADDVNGRAPSRAILSENLGLACEGGSRLT